MSIVDLEFYAKLMRVEFTNRLDMFVWNEKWRHSWDVPCQLFASFKLNINNSNWINIPVKDCIHQIDRKTTNIRGQSASAPS